MSLPVGRHIQDVAANVMYDYPTSPIYDDGNPEAIDFDALDRAAEEFEDALMEFENSSYDPVNQDDLNRAAESYFQPNQQSYSDEPLYFDVEPNRRSYAEPSRRQPTERTYAFARNVEDDDIAEYEPIQPPQQKENDYYVPELTPAPQSAPQSAPRSSHLRDLGFDINKPPSSSKMAQSVSIPRKLKPTSKPRRSSRRATCGAHDDITSALRSYCKSK